MTTVTNHGLRHGTTTTIVREAGTIGGPETGRKKTTGVSTNDGKAKGRRKGEGTKESTNGKMTEMMKDEKTNVGAIAERDGTRGGIETAMMDPPGEKNIPESAGLPLHRAVSKSGKVRLKSVPVSSYSL